MVYRNSNVDRYGKELSQKLGKFHSVSSKHLFLPQDSQSTSKENLQPPPKSQTSTRAQELKDLQLKCVNLEGHLLNAKKMLEVKTQQIDKQVLQCQDLAQQNTRL